MFPLDFPLSILTQRAQPGDVVLDPFCGRGTTNLAARLVGLTSMGVDSSPVAVAITAAKLVSATVDEIVAEARQILVGVEPHHIPTSEFWQWAYHWEVLTAICKFREAFLTDCVTAPRVALRAIILGALHGPRQKRFQSYFSNQCPRTYAPKPAYATSFWKHRNLVPEPLDVMPVIARRARRYYQIQTAATGKVRLADSRSPEALQPEVSDMRFRWVITSPPYYGMRTYIPDQWLRNWFLGGSETVPYSGRDQITHASPHDFVGDIRKVWQNAARVCSDDATMVFRFGGITDRRASPLDLAKSSLRDTGWQVAEIHQAGSAREGKRQADTFLRAKTEPLIEYDIWAIRDGLSTDAQF